jgi:ParB/RepB/Spo0J family partition protein
MRLKKMSEVIKNLLISTLKEHGENEKYFDNVVGEDYTNLMTSIKNNGVLAPVIVSADMTIISGHQRVRACKELGFESVPCIILDSVITDEEKLEHLISSNFGRSQNSESKRNKAILKYVELCGLKRGEKANPQKCGLQQKEIAKIMGISERKLQQLIQLEKDLAPEAKELLDTNKITTSIALNAFCKMPKENQVEFLESVNPDVLEELTTKQVKALV